MRSIGENEANPENVRVVYVCLSCTKMLSEEELEI
jgi:hypothetical protein